MIITAIFFYLFAGVCIASAVMVIAARNPVHSVLFLILAFVNAAGLFVLLGAEFTHCYANRYRPRERASHAPLESSSRPRLDASAA